MDFCAVLLTGSNSTWLVRSSVPLVLRSGRADGSLCSIGVSAHETDRKENAQQALHPLFILDAISRHTRQGVTPGEAENLYESLIGHQHLRAGRVRVR